MYQQKQNKRLPEKVAIAKPDTHTNILNNSWEQSRKDVQKIVDLYYKIGLPALVPAEFRALFLDTENLLFDKISGGATHLEAANGTKLVIDKHAALAMMQKPKGYAELMQAVSGFDAIARRSFHDQDGLGAAYTITDIEKHFQLNEDGKTVDFTDVLKEKIEESGNHYIITERGQAVNNFLTAMTKAFFESGLSDYLQPVGNERYAGEDNDMVVSSRLCGLILDNMRGINFASKEYRPKSANNTPTLGFLRRLPADTDGHYQFNSAQA